MLGTLQFAAITLSFVFGAALGFIGILALAFYVAPVAVVVALVNLVGLLVYVIKCKPRGKELVASIALLVLSMLVLFWVAFMTNLMDLYWQLLLRYLSIQV